jgi:hypothetical protein
VPSNAALPRPESLRQPGEKLEGQTFVVRKKTRGVHIPETLEGAQTNHIYTKALDEAGNSIMAYIEVPFDVAENQYPKMLYHPDWGKITEPKISDFARPGIPADQYEQALSLFNTAHGDWQKSNRTRVVPDAKRETDLRKIGWVDYKDLKHLGAAQTKAESDAL